MLLLTMCRDYKKDLFYFYHDLKTHVSYRYIVKREEFEKMFRKTVPAGAGSGPVATLATPTYDGKFYLTIEAVIALIVIISLIVAGALILHFHDLKALDSKVKNSKYVYETELEDLECLYYDGTKRRLAVTVLIFLTLWITYVLFVMAVKTADVTCILFFYFCIFLVTVFIANLAPIQTIRFKLYLRRCEKEFKEDERAH